MAKANIELVDIRDDKSVVVFYDTGTCRPYKSVDVLPKTALTWLEKHQPAADPDPVEEVVEEPIVQVEEPVVLTVVPQVPAVVSEKIQEPEKPLLRGLVAMAPFVAAIGVINMLIVFVAGIGILAEIWEAVKLVLIELGQEAREGIRPVIQELRVWWAESVRFRQEIILLDKWAEDAI